MKDNKGFATSFILFSILALFLILLSVLLFTLNNSITLNGKLKNDLVNEIEDVETYRQYNYSSTQFVQEFVAPKARNYTIKAWSANGTYVYSNVELNRGEKLYLYVGELNGFNNGKTEIRTIYGDDQESINSRILYVGDDKNTSTTTNKLTNVIKKDLAECTANELRPQNETNGFIRIYYTISAKKVGYNNARTGLKDQEGKDITDLESALKEIWRRRSSN